MSGQAYEIKLNSHAFKNGIGGLLAFESFFKSLNRASESKGLSNKQIVVYTEVLELFDILNEIKVDTSSQSTRGTISILKFLTGNSNYQASQFGKYFSLTLAMVLTFRFNGVSLIQETLPKKIDRLEKIINSMLMPASIYQRVLNFIYSDAFSSLDILRASLQNSMVSQRLKIKVQEGVHIDGMVLLPTKDFETDEQKLVKEERLAACLNRDDDDELAELSGGGNF